MHCSRIVSDNLFWVGGSDRRIPLFENSFPVPRGMAYNAYLLMDEKTVLLDTVDRSVGDVFFENLTHVLGSRPLDYVVVQHMEPDHCATLCALCDRHPETRIVTNAKSAKMIANFFTDDLSGRLQLVAEGGELSVGTHTLAFYMAPMVHWPEVMITYDKTGKTLFSADAFGTFGAFSGNLFADEMDFAHDWLPEARRYYANIVGKYGPQVQALLKKSSGLEIQTLCPLHGPVWRKDIPWYVDKYQHWSTYTPEETAVVIAYASVYGHTENAAGVLATKLAERGTKNIAMYDVSSTHSSTIISEAFRASHLVLCSTTYNAGLFTSMENLLAGMKAHGVQNRTVALIENGSWAPAAGKLMRTALEEMKDMRVLDRTVTLESALKSSQEADLDGLAAEIVASMGQVADGGSTSATASASIPAPGASGAIDPKTFFSIGYGLYVLTGKDGQTDSGCIINTLLQVTSQPQRISVAVNKQNFTHDLIQKTGEFNVSILTEEAPFTLFQHFGFQSGRNVDKFVGRSDPRSENGLRYVAEATNALLSGKVIQAVDCGTHTLFIADVTAAKVLSAAPSTTYAYYSAHIKPKPQPMPEQKRGYVCKICGYFHEGDTLPPDFICPICKHGAEDFEAVGF